MRDRTYEPLPVPPSARVDQGKLLLIYDKWAHLNDAPFRLLLGMAINASHDTEPPTFTGTWENLAWLIGKDTPADPHAADTPEGQVRRSHYEITRRAVRYLVDANAMRILRPAAHGRPAVYGLYIDTEPEPECVGHADEPGWIYYVRFVDRVKIGYTADVKRRLKRYPPGAELLGSHRGTLADEAALHDRFSAHLLAGREWFAISPDIMGHIAAHAAPI